ncbi:T9SS type A sorting domain-containing protein [Dyadobacter luticola]|uniref:T9SS type A sorting domain-containing protein n=1 Tax=Dyadobacter luticola TaxID=1979387 RepID=A0A5R9L2N0_9BACT|nr:T9SS type A sorting domain-containing protein [Dyadobacter luticola]TLV02555.1 T9SS type A sorting domain-containing protein [Dyadobacter luticola]
MKKIYLVLLTVIERSADGKNWQIINRITAQHESSATHLYTFTDERPAPETNYYRLKMVDLDDTYAYSRIVKVDLGNQLNTGIYPNPVSEKFHIGANDIANLKQIEIFNLEGKLVEQISGQIKSAVDIKHLPAGQYVIRLKKENGNVINYKLAKL